MSAGVRRLLSFFRLGRASNRARRRQVRVAQLILLSAIALSMRPTRGLAAIDPLEPNLASAIARGDLDYSSPATRSEEGMPIGNGRMGSLVWTTPSAIKFQINRVDVFGQDASTVSFPKQDSDYASGCGYVDINFASANDDPFTGTDFHQHLACYNGT